MQGGGGYEVQPLFDKYLPTGNLNNRMNGNLNNEMMGNNILNDVMNNNDFNNFSFQNLVIKSIKWSNFR